MSPWATAVNFVLPDGAHSQDVLLSSGLKFLTDTSYVDEDAEMSVQQVSTLAADEWLCSLHLPPESVRTRRCLPAYAPCPASAQALPMLLDSGFPLSECLQIMQEMLAPEVTSTGARRAGSDASDGSCEPVALAQQFEAEARLGRREGAGGALSSYPQHHQLTVTHHHHHHTHAVAVSTPSRPTSSSSPLILPLTVGHSDALSASTGLYYNATYVAGAPSLSLPCDARASACLSGVQPSELGAETSVAHRSPQAQGTPQQGRG
jgi:hypothetical protein